MLIFDTARNNMEVIYIINIWLAQMADIIYQKDFGVNNIHNCFQKYIKVFNYSASNTLKKATYNYISNYLMINLCSFKQPYSTKDLINRLKPLMLLIKAQRLLILSTLPDKTIKSMLQRATDNFNNEIIIEISKLEGDIGAAIDFLIRQEKLMLKSNQLSNDMVSPSYLDYMLQLYLIRIISHFKDVNYLTSENDIARAQKALILASCKELENNGINPEPHKTNGEKSYVEINGTLLAEQDKLIIERLINELGEHDVTQLLSPVSEQELVYYGSVRVTPLVYNVLHFLNLLSKMHIVMQQVYDDNIVNPLVLESNNLEIIFEEYLERVKTEDVILSINTDNDSKLPAKTGPETDTNKAMYELFKLLTRKMDQTKPKNTFSTSVNTNNINQRLTGRESLVIALKEIFTKEKEYPLADIFSISKLIHDNMILFIRKIKYF